MNGVGLRGGLGGVSTAEWGRSEARSHVRGSSGVPLSFPFAFLARVWSRESMTSVPVRGFARRSDAR